MRLLRSEGGALQLNDTWFGGANVRAVGHSPLSVSGVNGGDPGTEVPKYRSTANSRTHTPATQRRTARDAGRGIRSGPR